MLAREQAAAHLTPARDGFPHACTSQEASTPPSESSGFPERGCDLAQRPFRGQKLRQILTSRQPWRYPPSTFMQVSVAEDRRFELLRGCLEGPFAAPVPHAPPGTCGPVTQQQVKIYLARIKRFEDVRCRERHRTVGDESTGGGNGGGFPV